MISSIEYQVQEGKGYTVLTLLKFCAAFNRVFVLILALPSEGHVFVISTDVPVRDLLEDRDLAKDVKIKATDKDFGPWKVSPF